MGSQIADIMIALCILGLLGIFVWDILYHMQINGPNCISCVKERLKKCAHGNCGVCRCPHGCWEKYLNRKKL